MTRHGRAQDIEGVRVPSASVDGTSGHSNRQQNAILADECPWQGISCMDTQR